MPDCAKSFYTDGKYGYKYFTFLTEELPLIVGNYFPASRKREDTYIAGISMGGYGALKAAMWRPDLYAGVAALSAAVDPWTVIASLPEGTYSCTDLYENIRNIFGSQEEFYNSYNDLFRAADRYVEMKHKDMLFFICCGEQDLVYDENVKLSKYMEEAGISVTFTGGRGMHSWDYWNKILPQMLESLGLMKQKERIGSF